MKSIHDPSYKVLIQRLKQARLAAGLTQTALAKLLGTDQTYVSKYESRERRLDVIEVRRICRALELKFGDFIREFEKEVG